MDKTTKKFIIILALLFVIITLIIMFGGYSYQLKGYNPPSAQSQNNNGSVDMKSYTEAMHNKISSKWTPPSVEKGGKVIVEYTIQKNGHIINEKIETSSGNKELDASALKALRKASPLPPLPMNLKQDSINAKFNFIVKGKSEE